MIRTPFSTSIFSALALTLFMGCTNTTNPTAPPAFDATRGFTYVDSNGGRTALTAVDYSVRTSASAYDFAPTTEPETPNGPVPDNAGIIAFVFDQLLNGTTVELPQNRPAASGQDITIGQGDWAGKFKIIDGFTPNANVIAYVDSTLPGAQPTADNSQAFPTYRPDGAWSIDPAAKIWEFPPPAIAVLANSADGTFPAGQIAIIHLLANQVKGISGQFLPPATNSAGEVITVQLPGVAAPVPVAATVVVQFP